MADPKSLAEVTPSAFPAPAAAVPAPDLGDYLIDCRKRDGERYVATFCPESLRTFDPEHPTAQANREAISKVLLWERGAKGLLLTGPTGKCKTRASWQLLARLYRDEGVECRWWHSADFFAALGAEVKYGRDDARGWVDAVASRPVVFLDDWGQEANLKAREDWAQSWFFRFIDLRLERRLPIIITTNLQAKDIAGMQADSIRADPLLRRLLELCEVVKFK